MRPIVFAIWFFSALSASLHFTHILQLSSYQTQGYLRWLKAHAGEAYQKFIWVLPTLFLWMWWGTWALFAAAGFYLLSLWWARPPKGAKKPLKITSRVVRLYITLSLLLAAAGRGISFLWDTPRFLLVALGVAYLAVSLLVPLANVINRPVQKLVEGRYIRDARRKLAAVPNLVVIGVTGSYGKTSTKYFLQRLLSVRYNTLMTPESYNTPMGVVRTVRERLRATHEIFVCEMGARHVGDIRELCGIVRPRYGVLTSIGPQHLETFGSMDNIVKTKFELADSLPENGAAFLNCGNEHVRNRAVTRVPAVGYALSETDTPGLSYRAHSIRAGAAGLAFSVSAPDGTTQAFTTALIGRHNVENITAAVAVAHHLGIPLSALVPAVRSLEPVPHRLRLLPGPDCIYIDDAFNANPEGARVALETLSGFDGMKILVTPGFVELGDRQDECNEELGRVAAAVCDFVALVGEKQTGAIARGLSGAGFPPERLTVAETLHEALAAVHALDAGREKYVLLENDLPDNY